MNRRMQDGQQWEEFVVTFLRAAGWTAFRYGQGLLSEDARDMLREFKTHIRWAPDIITTDPDRSALFVIDAKYSSAERTGNHAVECSSTAATLLYHQPDHNVWALYAFPHMGTPKFVAVDVWSAHSFSASWHGDGSGTPFRCAPCDPHCHANPFDAIKASNQHREETQ